jgi:mono/diheme cytochrome c family protein
MRGQFEGKLAASLKDDFPKSRLEEESAKDVTKEFEEYWATVGPEDLEFAVSSLKEDWTLSEDTASVIKPASGRPESTVESIARGRAIFIGPKAKCAACHGESARGDGPSTEIVNDLPGQPGVKGENPGLYDVWGNIVKPRNLTLGVFRGGRRPIDIYRRISEGIKGTPMQAFGTTFKEEEIWDVVNYVLSVPFENK